MMRFVQSMSAANSKAYFEDSLTKAEYYVDEQELAGTFNGKMAARLGLARTVDKETFYRLCDNLLPDGSGSITPITKEERTVSYDINFHAPKSVSIAEFLSNDGKVVDAFRDSVERTMKELEADARVRVRKGKADYDKPSGELVWSTFVHKTSRPVPNHLPDPHLHAHCVTFNLSYDKDESIYKACQFREINRAMPYYQALFHKHLSDRLMELGYNIRRTRSAFEIEGVPKEAIALFSKRTDEIGRIAKEKGIINPNELSQLGAKTRSRKNKDITMGELKAAWRSQIIEHQLDKISPDAIVKRDRKVIGRFATADRSVDHSLQHNFTRSSVVPTKRVLQEAFRHSIGSPDVSPEHIKNQFSKNERLIILEEGTQLMCTTQDVLREERDMVQLAKKGNATMKPLYQEAPQVKLEGQQAKAVTHILTTSDQVSIVHGAAGAGKTTLMTEAIHLIKKAGTPVFTVAPSSDASRDKLRAEGFLDAETVAQFLTDKRLHERIANGVLWVDEAGLLGTGDAKRLLEVTQSLNARLILGGDYKQHSSVARGDALRVLKKYGGIKAAEVSKIFRQQKQMYRSAIQDMVNGKVRVAFEKLDEIGSIREVSQKEPNKELVADYLAALKAGKSTLVICPTHEHGARVTADIRSALQERKLLGTEERNVTKYDSLRLTEAQRGDVQNYHEGLWIRFNLPAKGVSRGSMWQVKRSGNGSVTLENEIGKTANLPLDQPNRFDVMAKDSIPIAKGDKIRITQGAFDTQNKRMENGTILEVTGLSKDGTIKLRNATSKCKYVLHENFGHITHAHCITSHASQGKTVDEVFIAQPSPTFAASNAKQFYVSASRGRTLARFYTDDKEGLLDHVSKLGDRQSAIEFVNSGTTPDHKDYVKIRQREDYDRKERTPSREERVINKERDYEP